MMSFVVIDAITQITVSATSPRQHQYLTVITTKTPDSETSSKIDGSTSQERNPPPRRKWVGSSKMERKDG